MINYYKTLGAKRDDDYLALRRLYLAAAERTHPDKGGSVEDFKEVQEAWAVFGSEKERAKYDAKIDLLGQRCPACDGRGATRKQKGFYVVEETRCEMCHGAGVVAI